MGENYSEAELLYEEGIDLVNAKNPEGAIAAYKKALSIDPDYGDAYFALGFVLLSLERYDEAKKVFAQLESVDANYPFAISHHGYACLELEEYEEADHDFRRALDRDETDHFAMFGHASILTLQENYREALGYIAQALHLESDDTRYYYLLGFIYNALGYGSKAVLVYGTATALCPEAQKEIWSKREENLYYARN